MHHKKGRSKNGHKVLPRKTLLYRRTIDYHLGRLKIRKLNRRSRETSGVKNKVNTLRTGISYVKFDGKDPILIFDLLSCFVTDVDVLGLSKAHAYVAVPHLMMGFALEQYRAVSQSLNCG